ncbi:hypothetical protein LZ32DRAFT_185525 [Colletotrichum eremochloae]|nr:hypothetical protein LZ32DRAFT_185525 [Colletotrichum eremochloae]
MRELPAILCRGDGSWTQQIRPACLRLFREPATITQEAAAVLGHVLVLAGGLKPIRFDMRRALTGAARPPKQQVIQAKRVCGSSPLFRRLVSRNPFFCYLGFQVLVTGNELTSNKSSMRRLLDLEKHEALTMRTTDPGGWTDKVVIARLTTVHGQPRTEMIKDTLPRSSPNEMMPTSFS